MDPVTETIDISGSGDLVSLVTRQLSVSPVLDADSNNYSCEATNENQQQPNVSVEFELIVRGECIDTQGRLQLDVFCSTHI